MKNSNSVRSRSYIGNGKNSKITITPVNENNARIIAKVEEMFGPGVVRSPLTENAVGHNSGKASKINLNAVAFNLRGKTPREVGNLAAARGVRRLNRNRRSFTVNEALEKLPEEIALANQFRYLMRRKAEEMENETEIEPDVGVPIRLYVNRNFVAWPVLSGKMLYEISPPKMLKLLNLRQILQFDKFTEGLLTGTSYSGGRKLLAKILLGKKKGARRWSIIKAVVEMPAPWDGRELVRKWTKYFPEVTIRPARYGGAPYRPRTGGKSNGRNRMS